MTTVYTKPQCVQCDMTKRMMDKIGVEYTTVDIVENPEELNKLIEMGYRAAPVVVTDNDSWAGFQPDKINALAAQPKYGLPGFMWNVPDIVNVSSVSRPIGVPSVKTICLPLEATDQRVIMFVSG